MTFSNFHSQPPAFLINQKLSSMSNPYAPTTTRARTQKPSACQRLAKDGCFSVCNLTLIIFPILALVFAAKFLYDDTLYEFGEHLLSRRFYRQIIYIIVVLPLILLVPLFNAMCGFFLSSIQKHQMANSLLIVKVIYQILVALLAFIGLFFVAPTIRANSVARQLDYEFRIHMKRRYESDFSYNFIDRVQEEYQCCDQLWYQANYYNRIPMSCFRDRSYALTYARTCPDAIGAVVARRCFIIFLSLLVMLLSLGLLVVFDVCELLANSDRQYDVEERERKLIQAAELDRARNDDERDEDQDDLDDSGYPLPPRSASFRSNSSNSPSSARANSADVWPPGPNEFASEELERHTPLLQRSTRVQSPRSPSPSSAQRDDAHLGGPDESSSPAPLLARANYVPAFRSQSPILPAALENERGRLRSPQSNASSHDQRRSPSQSVTPTKGVLKKTSSFQRLANVDSSDSGSNSELGQEELRRLQQEQDEHHQRDIQAARRIAMNVRFADV